MRGSAAVTAIYFAAVYDVVGRRQQEQATVASTPRILRMTRRWDERTHRATFQREILDGI
jgi:hypothetical protein